LFFRIMRPIRVVIGRQGEAFDPLHGMIACFDGRRVARPP
jgi:hypothetical protein